MSKYNLTDILEQYRIGSGWTTDFDYDGMLKAGLKAGVDTDIEVLKKMSDDFEDVNYHRENNHLQNAIEALEEGAIKEASMFFGDFHAEIKQTIKDQGMDIEPTLGKFMDAKMDMMNEDEFDEARQSAIESSQEAAGIKEVTSREGSRIEGLLSIPLKSKFLEAFQDLYFDLVEEDPFMAEDVVDHLGIEMLKHLDAIQAQGDSLAGIDDFEQEEFTAIPEGDTVEEGITKDDIKKALKGTEVEIKAYMDSLKRSGDKFDSIEDYVEDFENYVADKSLQEHFGRFMKDYQ